MGLDLHRDCTPCIGDTIELYKELAEQEQGVILDSIKFLLFEKQLASAPLESTAP